MKKLFVAFCAVAVFAMMGCKKDPVTPTPGPAPEPNYQVEPLIEGQYNPSVKIEYVAVDGNPSEEWVWVGNQLNVVRQDDGNGSYSDAISFVYDGNRVQELNYSGSMMSGTMSLEYDGNGISTISLVRDGEEMLSAQVDHSEPNKISQMQATVDGAYINELLGSLLGNFSFGKGGNTKLEFTGGQASVDYVWDGDNVSRMIANISVSGSVTLNEINNVIDIRPYINSYLSSMGLSFITADMILAAIGDSPMPVALTVSDTIDYTYDAKINPFRGYMGNFDVSMLSGNNVTASNSYGQMNAVLTVSYMGMGGDMPISYPVPSQTSTFTYTYNAAGFPLTVTDGDGSVTEYTYKQ